MTKPLAAGVMLHLRTAQAGDVPALEALIERSARGLSRGHYDGAQVDAAIAHIFGVDSELIADGTYYLVEGEGGEPVACGGWSARGTLFGGDRFAVRDDRPIDPARDPARIRAFFVDPAFARQGLAARLLDRCEEAAAAAGFSRLELMATLPGLAFYRRAGFETHEEFHCRAGAETIPFVRMSKALRSAPGREGATKMGDSEGET
ncbi:GNAT family N-acetyltransferase [Sphingomonas hengshuiensis]|uniref:GNAT family N-acetyltransferase n=1 Tax=Sphingomonas hengshuiensis TaxID=1609977 RepID=UPI000A7D5238|nr:GNAT family N-acetyltransferase [Sphingomonas hengshuiensis]